MNTTAIATYRFQQRNDIRSNFRASRTTSTPLLSSNINRLISAAVASTRFRRLLLADPIAAVSMGYNGESFSLTPDESAHIAAIQATSLQDFAARLIQRFQLAEKIAEYATKPEPARMPRFNNVGMSTN